MLKKKKGCRSTAAQKMMVLCIYCSISIKVPESDTSAGNNWPDFKFDPYDESPDVSDASPFVPYTTYAERNKTSSPTHSVSYVILS